MGEIKDRDLKIIKEKVKELKFKLINFIIKSNLVEPFFVEFGCRAHKNLYTKCSTCFLNIKNFL